MLYLEDYLEMIEHLPIELRDRFTEMREIDLGVENTVDSLEARQKDFFARAGSMSLTEREEEYAKIRKDHLKAVEESKEKIQIAEESYGLVDRYLRKLDQELHKFQLELEADNRGITEVLEKRSLELDAPASRPSMYLKENRLPKKLKMPTAAGHTTIAHTPESEGLVGRAGGSGHIQSGSSGGSSAGVHGQVYSLDQIGASSSAIAQAASQAIAATQLVSGRRSSSLKASYEAINLGVATSEFSIGRELATAANSALAATSTDLTSSGQPQQARVRQHKLKLPKTSGMSGLGLDVMAGGSIFDSDVVDTPSMALVDPVLGGQVTTPSPLASISSPMASLGGGGQTPGQGSDQEWNYDPNEPRYCICNQVSYGDMVACDNEDCPYEWFHYPCVGVTAPPKGKWYCQPCISSAQRRRGRKN